MDNGLCIFGAAALTESVRVLIPSAFSNGVQSLFPLSLVPAVKHAGNTKRAKLSIGLGNVNSAHWFAVIIALPNSLRANGREFPVWIIPYNSILTWSIFSVSLLVVTMRTAIARATQEFTRSC
jgi:hypothetical protein